MATADLVEPIAGSLLRLVSTPREIAEWRAAGSTEEWALARTAAKEAVRSHLQRHLGRDVHPATLELLAMRPDRYVVVNAPTLSAQELIDHVGPTRYSITARLEKGVAIVHIEPNGRE